MPEVVSHDHCTLDADAVLRESVAVSAVAVVALAAVGVELAADAVVADFDLMLWVHRGAP
jgi:hypothetical protein